MTPSNSERIMMTKKIWKAAHNHSPIVLKISPRTGIEGELIAARSELQFANNKVEVTNLLEGSLELF